MPVEIIIVIATCISAVTGLATVVLVVFIDPFLSIMTDDALEGKKSEAEFRGNIQFILGSRVAGTLLAQVIILPVAKLVAFAVSI